MSDDEAPEEAPARPSCGAKRAASSSAGGPIKYVQRTKVTTEYLQTVVKPLVKWHRPRAVGEEGRADILHALAVLRHENETTRGRKKRRWPGGSRR